MSIYDGQSNKKQHVYNPHRYQCLAWVRNLILPLYSRSKASFRSFHYLHGIEALFKQVVSHYAPFLILLHVFQHTASVVGCLPHLPPLIEHKPTIAPLSQLKAL